MADRIVLHNMAFMGRHGWYEHEQLTPQRFEVDLELSLDLTPAARDDDLERTVDYGRVFQTVREIVEARSFKLLEALADAIAEDVLTGFGLVDRVVVRVRKPDVELGGTLDWAGVEVSRGRTPPG